MTRTPAATSRDVRPRARFSWCAAGESAASGGETAPVALRRISSATKVETASTTKAPSATRKPVSTVRIAEASIEATARNERKA